MGPPLTRRSLERLLAAEGITETAYHLYGAHIDNAYVLDQRPDDADACLHLLEQVLRDERNRYELVAGPAPPAEADAAFEAWLQERGLTRIDLTDQDFHMDEVPWRRDEPYYRRYFIRRKRFARLR